MPPAGPGVRGVSLKFGPSRPFVGPPRFPGPPLVPPEMGWPEAGPPPVGVPLDASVCNDPRNAVLAKQQNATPYHDANWNTPGDPLKEAVDILAQEYDNSNINNAGACAHAPGVVYMVPTNLVPAVTKLVGQIETVEFGGAGGGNNGNSGTPTGGTPTHRLRHHRRRRSRCPAPRPRFRREAPGLSPVGTSVEHAGDRGFSFSVGASSIHGRSVAGRLIRCDSITRALKKSCSTLPGSRKSRYRHVGMARSPVAESACRFNRSLQRFRNVTAAVRPARRPAAARYAPEGAADCFPNASAGLGCGVPPGLMPLRIHARMNFRMPFRALRDSLGSAGSDVECGIWPTRRPAAAWYAPEGAGDYLLSSRPLNARPAGH